MNYLHGPLRPWACPLCGIALHPFDVFDHGVAAHPATLPRRLTVRHRLALIPALALEVARTIDAPNPSGYTAESKRTRRSAQPLPINTAVEYLFAPGDGNRPDRPLSLLGECTRIVWETLTPEQRSEHPLPDGDAGYGDAAWLASVWDEAQASLDLVDVDWIDGITSQITNELVSVARLSMEPRYACPDCGQDMHLGLGDWMICESDQHQHPGPNRLRDQWRRRPPMSTNHLAAELRIPAHQIHVWHNRGLITPTRAEGRTLFWLPWDIIGRVYPDIVRAIENAEAGPPSAA